MQFYGWSHVSKLRKPVDASRKQSSSGFHCYQLVCVFSEIALASSPLNFFLLLSGTSVLLTIFLLHWAVLLTPGANFLLVGQLAASGRRSTACTAALGVTTVTITWATLAILGIGLIISAHPLIRQVFQVAGGGYLCYLGLKLWRSQGGGTSIELNIGKWAAFRLGFFSNLLNPKTALFFCSVFGTSLPAHPSTLLVASAVALVYLNALVWYLFLALAFSHSRIQAGYNRYRGPFNKVSGAMMGGFGLKLVWTAL